MIYGTEALGTHIPALQTDELKQAIADLRAVKTRIQRVRSNAAHSWHMRSYGEPSFESCSQPGEVVDRVRFIESWLGHGVYRIGRVKLELQYIFPGTSLLESLGLEDNETPDILSAHRTDDSLSFLALEAPQQEGVYADRCQSSLFKVLFHSDGTARGTLHRRESEAPAYIVGLDDGVDLETLQSFGRNVGQLEEDYRTEVINAETCEGLVQSLNIFSIIENHRISQQEASGFVYYE